MREFLTMFAVVFFAEFGDKTQLATVLFASEQKLPPLAVFAACGSALLLSSAFATFFGSVAGSHLANVPFKLIAGAGFMIIGALTLVQYFRAA